MSRFILTASHRNDTTAAGATANADFPIVQALENHKKRPAQPKKRAPPRKRRTKKQLSLSPDLEPSSELYKPIPELELNKIIAAADRPQRRIVPTSKMSNNADEYHGSQHGSASSDEVTLSSTVHSGKKYILDRFLNPHFNPQATSTPYEAQKVAAMQSSEADASCPSRLWAANGESGTGLGQPDLNQDFSPITKVHLDTGLAEARPNHPGENDITSGSSALPYSSPLEDKLWRGQDDSLAHPLPQRLMQPGMMQAMESWKECGLPEKTREG